MTGGLRMEIPINDRPLSARVRLTLGRKIYPSRLPAILSVGRVLVQNQVIPTRRLGSRGFRTWLDDPDPARLQLCGCGWAPELGSHFTTRMDPWAAAGFASAKCRKR